MLIPGLTLLDGTARLAAHLATPVLILAALQPPVVEEVLMRGLFVHICEHARVGPVATTLLGTVRTLTEEIRDLCETRIRAVVDNVCAAFGATASITYNRGYPVTVNEPAKTDFMAAVAREVAGEKGVDITIPPLILYIFFNRQIVAGMTSGAVKG